MITFTDVLVLMLAYAGVSLSGICLVWHFNKPASVRAPADPSALWRTASPRLQQY